MKIIIFSEDGWGSSADCKKSIVKEIFAAPLQNVTLTDDVKQSSKEKKEKKMGMPCFCSRYKCHELLTEEMRKLIFEFYWNHCDEIQRRKFVLKRVEKVKKRRGTVECKSPRYFTLRYSFVVNRKTVQVCKVMFMNTLNITRFQIDKWINMGEHGLQELISLTASAATPSSDGRNESDNRQKTY